MPYRLQGAHWTGEFVFFFKVREKSGTSVNWSGKLENLQKSGEFLNHAWLIPQNLNKQIRDNDLNSLRLNIICNPVIQIYISHG